MSYVVNKRPGTRRYRPKIHCEEATVAFDSSVFDAGMDNMYGCTPCPRCDSRYRAPYMRDPKTLRMANGVPGAKMTVECDECGYKQWAVPRLEKP